MRKPSLSTRFRLSATALRCPSRTPRLLLVGLAAVSSVFGFALQAQINFPNGFQSGGTTLNGSAVVNGSALQLTDTNNVNEAGSAFYPTPVDIRNFTTDFTFRLTNASADGFMFVLQNQGPTALGSYGQFLGFGGMHSSAGVKFDLYDNAGEGPSSTGVYDSDHWPAYPAINLNANQIDLHSGDLMQVHMVYDGVTLFVTIWDTATNAIDTETYVTNLPSLVGGNTAYVGFTGGTGGLRATQQIITWKYTQLVAVARPQLYPSPNSTSFGVTQVTIQDSTRGAQIFYTTDGSTPTANSTLYTGPVPINGVTTLKAVAVLNSVASSVAGDTYTSSAPLFSFGSPGLPANLFFLNGSARVTLPYDYPYWPSLVLTDGLTNNQAGSAFYRVPVNVESFICDFTIDFRLPFPLLELGQKADGMMFVVQNQGPTALGAYGQFLGFGGIGKSVGLKLDIFNNAGEGAESTGLYQNGAWPAIPAFDLTPFDIRYTGSNQVFGFISFGDVVKVHMVYKKPTLQVVMINTNNVLYYSPYQAATQTYTIDIPAIVGAQTAYIGFTAGTGGYTTQAVVGSWTYSAP